LPLFSLRPAAEPQDLGPTTDTQAQRGATQLQESFNSTQSDPTMSVSAQLKSSTTAAAALAADALEEIKNECIPQNVGTLLPFLRQILRGHIPSACTRFLASPSARTLQQ